jgi:hypothetical protein
MGAIVEEATAGEEEKWRDSEESLGLAALEAVADVARAKEMSFCMRL